jgi:hypothetical protein
LQKQYMPLPVLVAVFFCLLEPHLWLNCVRHSVPARLPRHFIPQKRSAMDGASFLLQTQLVSFRKKTNGIKCHGRHFIPLFRVPRVPSRSIA